MHYVVHDRSTFLHEMYVRGEMLNGHVLRSTWPFNISPRTYVRTYVRQEMLNGHVLRTYVRGEMLNGHV